jgi:transposase InsO family protein
VERPLSELTDDGSASVVAIQAIKTTGLDPLLWTLEREVLNRRRFKTQAEAKMALFEWIEGWYNPHRRQSSLGYFSPVNFERRLHQPSFCAKSSARGW